MLKWGVLKKQQRSAIGMTWKNKRVEIRHGSLRYESDENWEEHTAKVLPLQHSICTVRAIRPLSRGLPMSVSSSSQNAIFELTVRGQPRRLWMAASKKERAEWIRAITDAMTGKPRSKSGEEKEKGGKGKGGKDGNRERSGSVGTASSGDEASRGSKNRSPDVSIDESAPLADDMQRFVAVRECVLRAEDEGSYMQGLSDVLGAPIRVPIQVVASPHTRTPPAVRLPVSPHTATPVARASFFPILTRTSPTPSDSGSRRSSWAAVWRTTRCRTRRSCGRTCRATVSLSMGCNSRASTGPRPSSARWSVGSLSVPPSLQTARSSTGCRR